MTRLNRLLLLGLLPFCTACEQKEEKSYNGWAAYGGSNENIHYSSLSFVDTSNVDQLQVAWVYHTGDADTAAHSQIQCNPIMVNGLLYGISPQLKLFALDAATGKKKWVFDPAATVPDKKAFFNLNNARGLSYWTDGKGVERLFYTAGSNLYSINAATGRPDSAFGSAGSIDLHEGLDRDVSDLFVTATSPGAIYQDLIIIGSRVDEGTAAAPGHIRAFDVRTGKRRWIFHTVPFPGEPGYESWEDPNAYKYVGGANAWSGFSLDGERGILFAATGSASPDFYGGTRKGANLFANCVLALDAATGKRIWHYQTVHHDVWDRDLPTPPALVTIRRNGKKIDAVAQVTKTGFVFVFERTTGKPVFPIREQPVPDSALVPGEKLWPTQPYPELPAPFVRQTFTEKEVNPLLPEASRREVLRQLATYRKGHMFLPASKEGTVFLPGLDGGGEWGGPSFDPATGWLYVNANEMAWLMTIVPLEQKAKEKQTFTQAGQRLYQANCQSCHGTGRQGSGNNPSLLGIQKRYTDEQFLHLVSSGRRMMPAFNHLREEEKKALAAYVLEKKDENKFMAIHPETSPAPVVPYTISGYNKFLSKEGYPAISPPWGTLNAIDLNTGQLVWKDTLGNDPRFAGKGVRTGTENYGGSVVTAGGLLFIAATSDGKFRAYHKRTGRLLWEVDLPAPAFATPSVYEVNGRQFIAIACGGGKLNTKSGDTYVAFALPKRM